MGARIRHLRHRELDGLERDRLDHLKRQLGIDVPAGYIREFAFTGDNTTDQLTVTGQDTLAANLPRVILIGNDLPLGLLEGTIYWLADAGTNLYTLHSSKAHAAAGSNDITFTDNGSGAMVLAFLD